MISKQYGVPVHTPYATNPQLPCLPTYLPTYLPTCHRHNLQAHRPKRHKLISDPGGRVGIKWSPTFISNTYTYVRICTASRPSQFTEYGVLSHYVNPGAGDMSSRIGIWFCFIQYSSSPPMVMNCVILYLHLLCTYVCMCVPHAS